MDISVYERSMKMLVLTVIVLTVFILASNAAAQTNLALNKSATQSSNYSAAYPASLAVNGKLDDVPGDFSHTKNEEGAWWQVDLGDVYDISDIEVWNRRDNECCWNRLQNFYVMVSENPITTNSKIDKTVAGKTFGPTVNESVSNYTSIPLSFLSRGDRYINISFNGQKDRVRYVRVFLNNGKLPLNLTEVRVLTWRPTPVKDTASAEKNTAAVEEFKKNLLGSWIQEMTALGTWANESEMFKVTQSNIAFYWNGALYNSSPYSIIDEKTVEFTTVTDTSPDRLKGRKLRAILSIEDNNTTLVWHRPDLNKVIKYRRAPE